jgi:hypothetical protein
VRWYENEMARIEDVNGDAGGTPGPAV